MKNIYEYIQHGTFILVLSIITGCSTDLSVENHNAPDGDRLLSDPSSLEMHLSDAFFQYWKINNSHHIVDIFSTIADELTSSWCVANTISAEPRQPLDNTTSYYYSNFENIWERPYQALSIVNDVLIQIERGIRFTDDEGNDHTMRNKAFCRFIQGICLGWLGLVYDRAFLVDEETDLEAELELLPYSQIIAAALERLNECIHLCNSNTFEIPESWWPGNRFFEEDLKRLAHAYIARILASQARTPEERAAADWATINSHAEAGITANFGVYCDGEKWWSPLHDIASRETWNRSDYRLIGPADTSGNYTAWLATPVQDRNYITIHTDDRRVTGGGPTQDGLYFRYYGECSFRPDRGTYHFSYYHSYRFLDYYQSGGVGFSPLISEVEMDLLRAEAELRLGSTQAAADLINRTRVNVGELPPADDSHVGHPDDPRTIHGSLWAMLKYEKGIETLQMQLGVAWFDRRGWGTLVPGTPLHFPIPARELEIMGMANYTFGGGGEGSAPEY